MKKYEFNKINYIFDKGDESLIDYESLKELVTDYFNEYELNKTKDCITAVSFNKEYEPFEIDKTKQFAVVGQVIGAMKRI